MKTIINTSTVTDYSGEPPIVTFSNPVTTFIRQTPPTPIITRIFYRIPCNCSDCCDCCCPCNCNCCRNNFC
ncbi:MAG: hypothetical protein K2L42_00065 [Clostridia bacterium]|nr:hypothetical protein [Clostridia bacterium]